ncbi:AAA family ATPase [Thiorhodococcus mannitoliphagus]|uniref:AAA family ATPase n=1 Tax=Thiorhodococcus mannitoliphagus TaxID=329406 RepID=A0A6P1DZB8_9GAMM|nr:AAA family ATPase [Thiorhodococcus mannitoliphagus]NEX22086.1 AAA family ATPase [Thiorhodococcus mannitoliphagus]
MRILATYNIKGGVGKTAAAVNLAYLAAKRGERTLLWDLDPQAAATYYFRVEPKVAGGGQGLLRGGKKGTTLDEVIKGTDFPGLDLVPADFSFRNFDLMLDDAKGSTKQLRKLLRPLEDDYDLVFLDCPPSISLVSESAFRAANALLVPVIPTTLSARTLEQLLEFLEGQARLDGLKVLPFFSMVDRRKRLHLESMAELPTRWPQFLKTSIPYASDVERMGVQRMPLPAYAPLSPAALAYQSLWAEVCENLPG